MLVGMPAVDRIIFSLKFELESIGTLERVQLITPLDAHGQTAHARAVPPKARIIDVRVGDWLRHRSEVYGVLDVRAYRDTRVAETTMLLAGEGYRYRLPA